MKKAAAEGGGVARLLRRLGEPGAVLERARDGGGFAIYPQGDRRRRPSARVSATLVAALASEGALRPDAAGAYRLGPAGIARAARADAEPGEAFRSQHDVLGAKAGREAPPAGGRDPGGALTRLARLTDASGRAFFAAREIEAAGRFRVDWAAGQAGLMRGSDWAAPPRGRTPRGGAAVLERARAGALDARARCSAAVAALGPTLGALIESLCAADAGLEGVERAQGWPARSGKVALKLALSLLADHYRLR